MIRLVNLNQYVFKCSQPAVTLKCYSYCTKGWAIHFLEGGWGWTISKIRAQKKLLKKNVQGEPWVKNEQVLPTIQVLLLIANF